jgi:hypothetical protein
VKGVNGARALAKALAVAAIPLACRTPPSGPEVPDAPASPQAKAEPAPLATIPAIPASAQPPVLASLDGGSLPAPLREDQALSSDLVGKDAPVNAYELVAVLRAADVPPPPKAPEVSLPGIDAARAKTEAALTIDLAPTRARFVLEGGGFTLAPGTELRARVDRYGYVVLAPDGETYCVAAPGALRALLGERRLDVAPLAAAEVTPGGEGQKRLGRATRKVNVATRAAKAAFEIAHVADVGEGGTLLCRALLDLVNASPSTPLCGEGDVPLRVELRWTTPSTPPVGFARSSASGAIVFDAVSLARRTDLPVQSLAAPPSAAAFANGLAPKASEIMLSPSELGAFRTGPVDVTPPAAPGAAQHPVAPADSALTLVNSTDELRFAWIDGVPVAWLAPGARETLRGLVRGRYVLQWRTFLGDALDAPQTIALPAVSDLGGADAGPPPP